MPDSLAQSELPVGLASCGPQCAQARNSPRTMGRHTAYALTRCSPHMHSLSVHVLVGSMAPLLDGRVAR
eukprot:362984-Chlamydomonas_euryale.AAC.4